MERIDGHIIDKSRMIPGGYILDAGCRGFGLPGLLGKGFRYVCLDPDTDIKAPDEMKDFDMTFKHWALKHYDGKANYCGWSTGEGNICYNGEAPAHAEKAYETDCVSIKTLSEIYGLFELIKLDIEGSEYDVLFSIDRAVAKQIAVEFHQCLGYNTYGTHDQYINKLMKSAFGRFYKIANWYEYPKIPGMYEYLFILK